MLKYCNYLFENLIIINPSIGLIIVWCHNYIYLIGLSLYIFTKIIEEEVTYTELFILYFLL